MTQPDQSKEFSVVLTLGELGNVLQGLQYIQYGTASVIIEKLQKQVADAITLDKEKEKAKVEDTSAPAQPKDGD